MTVTRLHAGPDSYDPFQAAGADVHRAFATNTIFLKVQCSISHRRTVHILSQIPFHKVKNAASALPEVDAACCLLQGVPPHRNEADIRELFHGVFPMLGQTHACCLT